MKRFIVALLIVLSVLIIPIGFIAVMYLAASAAKPDIYINGKPYLIEERCARCRQAGPKQPYKCEDCKMDTIPMNNY